jgi:hypothetical protein
MTGGRVIRAQMFLLATAACAACASQPAPGPLHVAVEYIRAHERVQVAGRPQMLLLDARRLLPDNAPATRDSTEHPVTSLNRLSATEVTLLPAEQSARCLARMADCARRGRVLLQLGDVAVNGDSAAVRFRLASYSEPDSAAQERMRLGQPVNTASLWAGTMHLARVQNRWQVVRLSQEIVR